MNITEAKNILNTQLVLGKTPKGRSITDYAKEVITSCMNDAGNQNANVSACKNCGIVVSVLLVADGCPNCGGLDFNSDVIEGNT